MGRDRAEPPPRPTNRRLLEPETDARQGRPGRVATGLRATHPAVATLAVVVASYLFLAVLLIGSGLVVTHLVAHGRVGHWDDHVNSWFANHRSRTWTSISADLTLVADTLGVVAVAALVTLVLLVRRWGRFALLLVIGLAIELAVFLSTTYLVARPRPHVQRVGSTPSTFSWPSGHAAATLVLYGGIAVLVMTATPKRFPRLLAWIVAVALTFGVVASRIYRGEHHPTDTMAGVVLGVGALWAAVLVIRTWGLVSTPLPAAEPIPTERAEPVPEIVAVSG